MLLKLEKLIAKYNMKITGVVQAGAHYGEELEDYERLGIKEVVCFEPCKESFNILMKKKTKNHSFYNAALGRAELFLNINKTSVNGGQSNSLLQPKKHLEYYPEIIFEGVEEVAVVRLDMFLHVKNECNFLVMDVQGYELEVLKGATETLKHIDYIYTEVNREELYENCAMVEDLDNYLTDFKRVETKWKRKGFGDALYIRKTLL